MPPRSRPEPEATTGGELDDHAWAMLAQAFQELREFVWIACGCSVVVTHMTMRNARTGFESLLSAFDLFRNRDRYRGVIGFSL